MKCPECRRGDQLHRVQNDHAWCRRCNVIAPIRPGAKVPGKWSFRGEVAQQITLAIAERGMPRVVRP